MKEYDPSKVQIKIGDHVVEGFAEFDDFNLDTTFGEEFPPKLQVRTFHFTKEKFEEFIKTFYGTEEEFLRRVPTAKITRPKGEGE